MNLAHSTATMTNTTTSSMGTRKKKRYSFETEKNESESFFMSSRPNLRFCDLGGIEACLQDIRELIEYPLVHPEIYVHLGVEPPRGILLHGPPGCGKTTLANAIAGVR